MLSSRKPFEVSENANLLYILSEVLMWKDVATFHRQFYANYLGLLSLKFDMMVATFVKAGVGSRLARLTQELPGNSLTRLITAPATVRHLLYDPPTDLTFFLHSVQAEQYRLSRICNIPKPIWTALGDYYFPAGHLDAFETPQDGVTLWNPDRFFRAPYLSNGLPIDYAGPFAMKTTIGVPPFSYAPLNQEEVQITLEKLEASLGAVSNISREAYDLITLYARVVVVRKDLTALGTFSSWSTDRYIGRIAFSNAQEEIFDVALTANNLVHEAIHAFLYVIEENYPFIEDRDVADKVRVQSPWSGRSLDLHSFTHACLVWFGLWHFWQLALQQGSFQRERVRQLVEQSQTGFHHPSMLDALNITSPYLSQWGHSIQILVEGVRRGVYN